MKFRSYMEARNLFQRDRLKLTVENLKEMIVSLNTMERKDFNLKEEMDIVDLIIDLDHNIDLIQNNDLLLHHRKKEYNPLNPKVIVKEKIFDTSPEPELITDLSFNLDLISVRNQTNLLERVEKEVVKQVIEQTKTKKEALKVLGISIRTLYNKINQHNLK